MADAKSAPAAVAAVAAVSGGDAKKAAAAAPAVLYHEKQSLQRCGIHTANNLLQCAAFTKQDFDAICHDLSPDRLVNPHKSVWGTGNYDVNVLTRAFATRKYELKWFDRRRPVTDIALDRITGVVVNETQSRLFGLMSAQHWIPLRAVDGVWYDLNSQLTAPKAYASTQAVYDDLQRYVKANANNQLLLLVPEGKGDAQHIYLSAAAKANGPKPAAAAAAAAVAAGDAKAADGKQPASAKAVDSKAPANADGNAAPAAAAAVVSASAPAATNVAADDLSAAVEKLHL